MSNWWEEAQKPAAVRSDSHEWIFQWAQQALAVAAMTAKGKPPIRVGAAGPVAHPNVLKDLAKLLEKEGAQLAEEAFYVWDDDFEEVYTWADGAAFVTTAEDSVTIGVNVVTTNAAFAEEVREFLHTNVLKQSKTNRGRVYILVSSAEGVRPQPLGFAAVPLEVENYDAPIHDQIRKMVSDLQTPFPDGRLTILEGPPGCGKTFLIRSLVHEIPTAKFIFVPPAMVPNLGDPSLVMALLGLNENAGEDKESAAGPIILICEDADSILTKRMADNMPAISTALNLTSGLLGDVIDIRLLATTNAERTQIEPALLRPGRLAQYIQVKPIDWTRATDVYRRLLNDPEAEKPNWPTAKVPVQHRGGHSVGFSSSNDEVPVEGKVLLADVFKLAKSKGWKPVKAKAKLDVTRVIPRRPRPYKAEVLVEVDSELLAAE